MAPAGAPVPGWPTSMRMTCGAPAGSSAWRTLAAVITSITIKGGAEAPLPIFRPICSILPLNAVRDDFHRAALFCPLDGHDAWFRHASALAQPMDLLLRQI